MPATNNPLTPHTFPYLVDKFFYTGASPTSATTSLFGDPTGDGWFKMFEFFEVPSQMIGAVGPVAQGTNFDWLRQDTKPGLINLNLIIDEEVFFSVFGSQQDQSNFEPSAAPELRPVAASPAFTGGSWTSATTPLAAGRGDLATSAGGDRNPGQRRTGGRLPDEQRGRAGHRPAHRRAQQPHEGLVRPVPVAAARRLGLRLRLRQRPSRPEHRGCDRQSQRPGRCRNNPIPADRPFHSLSYPDIDYTIMRPAALPPSRTPTRRR